MEGKNCFRRKWSQIPLYSGGNIASLLLPPLSSTSSSSKSEECLVTACGDTVNVLLANTGDLLASYTLPVEDVILRIDAVTVAPTENSIIDISTTGGKKNGENTSVNIKKNNKKGDKKGKNEVEELPAEIENKSKVPHGSYIAVGTRALQIYVFRLDRITEEKEGVGDKDKNEEKTKDLISFSDPNGTDIDGYSCTLTPLRSWTASQQAISVVQFTFDGRFLISGSTDGGVKVWDVFNHHLTHNLRLPSSSLVHSIYVDPAEKFLCIGSFEGHVAVFDFVSKTIIAFARPHVSAVEALTLTPDNEHLFSIARDRKLAICTLSKSELKPIRSVVVREHVSSAIFESPFRLHVGAMDGTVSTYSASVTESLRLLRRMQQSSNTNTTTNSTGDDDMFDEELAVRSLLLANSPKGTHEEDLLHGLLDDDSHVSPLYAADAAFNIALLVPDLETNRYNSTKTLVGFLDQVLDVKVFPPEFPYQRLVVTNSKEVRCYNSSGCLSSKTLHGHDDVVLTCAISADARLIATAGKGSEIRFWSTTAWDTVAIGQGGHTADITSIAFNTKQSESYMLLFSVSADENLRLWDVGMHVMPTLLTPSSSTTPVIFTHRSGINVAHEGVIYTMAVAPNDQYVATAGKDKNINLWTITGKKIYRDSSLKGHRRAVSSLAFSPADRVLASASNDGSVRLWSLVSLTCIKTLQMDRTPVLQVAFFNAGTQLVTGNAEGVLRVWAIGASETVWSGETHDDKIWALSVVERDDATVVFLSGSADGVLVATEDYTSEEADRVRHERHEMILKEQELANAMRKGQYTEAFLLALRLNHPRNLRQVIVRWSVKDPEECERALRHTILPALEEEQLLRLLQFTREWVTNARHSGVASLVMHCVLAAHHFTTLASMPAIRTILEALLAYMQRHSQRLHETLRRTYYMDYVTRSLGPATLTSKPPSIPATETIAVAEVATTTTNSSTTVTSSTTVSEPAAKRQRVEVA
ncbi:Small-subunit processome [Trypanosoma melophagium]|uniref:Small-subunit processome n=1 Tax=Trypanosoma melophagium TaxID=715481 RepID=UPI00351A1E56|nr:Small-subunit processome [Trypanosoma melophagium]